jgi:hypothetical protein
LEESLEKLRSSSDNFPNSWSGDIKIISVVLGLGTLRTVIRGTSNDEEVAVKRSDLLRLDPRDLEVKLVAQLNHENFFKMKTVEKHINFMNTIKIFISLFTTEMHFMCMQIHCSGIVCWNTTGCLWEIIPKAISSIRCKSRASDS